MRYREFATLIFENRQQYRQMLQGMVDAEIITPQTADAVANGARKALKRRDRIVWWLKWYRLVLTRNYFLDMRNRMPKDQRDDPETPDKINAAFEKITKSEMPQSPAMIQDVYVWMQHFDLGRPYLEHIMGMIDQIPQMNQMQWNPNIGPHELRLDIERIEREWQNSRHQWVTPESGDKILDGMTYNSGNQAWVILDRGACDAEGSAMGHCGNVPSVQPGDRILSFRTIKGEDHKPHLTFILHQSGMLGEMKGRANNKPDPKYHPYIIDLLKKPFIKGIAGGGYAPEENFELSDLSENQMSALLEEKPSLGGPAYMYKQNGRYYTPEIGEMLEPIIHDVLPYLLFDKESGTIIVETYKDIAEIGREHQDDVLIYISDVLEGNEIFEIGIEETIADYLDDRYIIDSIYNKLNDRAKTKLNKYIKASRDISDSDRDDPVEAIIELIENDSEIRYAFASGIYAGVEYGTLNKLIDKATAYLKSRGFEKLDEKTAKVLPRRSKNNTWMLETNAAQVLDFMIFSMEGEIDDYYWDEILGINGMYEPMYDWDGWDPDEAANTTIDRLDVVVYEED